MRDFIITSLLGLFVSILGIINISGNISTLHWYHRQRVTEENRKPFGKLIGLGTLVMGIALIIFSVLTLTKINALIILGTILLIAAFIVGMALSIYAMIKYNRGIF